MSHFSIMLVPDVGKTKSYRVSRKTLRTMAASVILSVFVILLGVYSLYSSYTIRDELNLSRDIIFDERLAFETEKAAFQAKFKAEEDKMNVYARSLGQMQARLSRLDALGKRLVQASSLSQAEFDFNVKPAFGGPRIPLNNSTADITLFDQIQHMDSQMSVLDTQLIAVDYLLQDEVEEKTARPHAWPSEGGWLSSHYGVRTDPFTAKKAMHRGIDIANRFGSSVLAGSRGVVIYTGKRKDYGYLVEIEHGYGYRTRYAHMSASNVAVGDIVQANQVIGRVGSSGRSTGPHLHYEVRRNGQALNPESFIPQG
ncbi:MAG: M23 family metallopeptidase [Mariprofundaceae bacterium]|nr:M23 family metallopeptidase [Mariprofundaceae bacterium]